MLDIPIINHLTLTKSAIDRCKNVPENTVCLIPNSTTLNILEDLAISILAGAKMDVADLETLSPTALSNVI